MSEDFEPVLREIRRTWVERHLIVLFLTVSVLAFDFYLLWQLHSALFYFGCLQVPVAIAVGVFCRVKRNNLPAAAMCLLLAIFPMTGELWEPQMVALRARRAGVAEVVREGRELARRFREESHGPGDEHGHPLTDAAIPPAISRLGPTYVWPGAREVGVKIFGVGTWAGYVILDSDTAEPDGQATVKRRIAPGLWWVERNS